VCPVLVETSESEETEAICGADDAAVAEAEGGAGPGKVWSDVLMVDSKDGRDSNSSIARMACMRSVGGMVDITE
jgi:hypothetical protein